MTKIRQSRKGKGAEMGYTLYKNTPITSNKNTSPVNYAIGLLKRDMDLILTQKFVEPTGIHIVLPEFEDPYNESFCVRVASDGIKVETASSLGGVFALLYISHTFLGVQPFWFWEQQEFSHLECINVPDGIYSSLPAAVRFRGWFLNDEVLLANWKPINEDTDFSWKMALESLLRCGGNMVIPGTDSNSKKNSGLANEMGLWITHHHAEPLGAEMFARAFPNEEPSYSKNKDKFLALWERGIQNQSTYNVVWALGFRGQGDRPFWADDPAYNTPESRGALISEVINEQYKLVCKYVERPVCCINLYGEILELYRLGHLILPKDVICIWADSGYGKMVSRRQGNHNPRVYALPEYAKGKHGIYYHASFYDLQASSHITQLPNSADMVCNELNAAYKAGCSDYWIINCGNVRPHSYILDLISALWHNPDIQASTHLSVFSDTYYDGHKLVANRISEYAQNTIQYGSHMDERAGEEFYHHPIREMTAAWIQGKTDNSLKSLWWFSEDKPFPTQVRLYHDILKNNLLKLQNYYEQCTETRNALPVNHRQHFYDQIELQALIHTSGAAGASNFCASFFSFCDGNLPKAFCYAWLARQQYARALEGYRKSEHGIWKSFYENDCLTDIRLTVSFMDDLLTWLRMMGEGADRHSWHRRYLMDEGDRGVILVTNFERPLGNSELANLLTQRLLLDSENN